MSDDRGQGTVPSARTVTGSPRTTSSGPWVAQRSQTPGRVQPRAGAAESSADDGVYVRPKGARRRGLVPALVTLGVLLLLTLGYIGAASALADQVPFNSTIGGVSVGGMGSEAAVAKLEEEFAGRATAPIEVSAGEAFDTLEPAAAGLAVDAAGSVADVTGFSLAPSRMWQHIVGAGRVSVDSAVDDAALTAALTDLASRVDTAPVDGAVTFVAAVPQAVTPVPGQRVDVAAAASLLSESWLTAAQPIAIPTTEVPPAADRRRSTRR